MSRTRVGFLAQKCIVLLVLHYDMRFCLLTGGTPHSDDLLGWKDSMERMGRSIAHFTPVLRNLHLPFINDYIADKLSFHPTLQVN